MNPGALAVLLKLPAAKRADLALALWDSLDRCARRPPFSVTRELATELDRRLADHVADPSSSISWAVARRTLSRRR